MIYMPKQIQHLFLFCCTVSSRVFLMAHLRPHTLASRTSRYRWQCLKGLKQALLQQMQRLAFCPG